MWRRCGVSAPLHTSEDQGKPCVYPLAIHRPTVKARRGAKPAVQTPKFQFIRSMNYRSFGAIALAATFGGSPVLTAQEEPPAPPQVAPAPQAPSPVAPQRPSGPIEVNGIAAKVNGRVVTKSEVSFMLAPIYAQLTAQFPRRGPEFERRFKEARENVLKEMIDRQILLDEFKSMGASIKPHIIDEEIKRQVRELYNGNEAKFNEELKKSRLTRASRSSPTRRLPFRTRSTVNTRRSRTACGTPRRTLFHSRRSSSPV
jgi:hypothetical protein